MLIVEDDEDTADTLAVLLEARGYRVEVITDGTAARAGAVRFRPRVVVLDLGLPGCDGCEVARQLLTSGIAPPPHIIVTTGYTDPVLQQLLFEMGVEGYFLKPADPRQLLAQVARFCGRGSGRAA